MKVEECCTRLLSKILPLIDDQREGVCIDIGVGTFAFYCELFKHIGFQSVAVEPLPVQDLRQLCQSLDILLVESCISEIDGLQTLYIGEYQENQNLNVSSLEKTWWGASKESRQVLSITLSTLLSIVKPLLKITCMKIDVEGAESKIIKQLKDLPENLLPSAIMFEYGGGATRKSGKAGWATQFVNATMDCLNILKAQGYNYSILIDSAKDSKEKILHLQDIELNQNSIFYDNANYGNIISFRHHSFLKNEIESICREFYEPSLKEISDLSSEENKGNEANLSNNGELHLIKKLIKPGQVVFDVGANVGKWAQSVIKSHSNIEMHLFEPAPENYQSLIKTISESLPTGNLIPNNCAIAKDEEIRTFNFYKEGIANPDKNYSSWSTFYRRENIEEEYSLKAPQTFPVFTTTLDAYCNRMNIRRIHFLKVDTEGAELEVLKGAENILRKGKVDYLQFEYGGNYLDSNATLKQVFECLHQFRYHLFKLHSNRVEYKPQFCSSDENFQYSNYLAVNERLVSSILGKPPKMLDLKKLCAKHSIVPKGIIHVGAYEGLEIEAYKTMAGKVLFVEANPIVFERLKKNTDKYSNVIIENCAISNEDGVAALHVTAMEQGSSILSPKKVMEIYPDVKETSVIKVPCKKLDTLIADLNLNSSDYNVLNIDIQGAELLAFEGATHCLKHIDAINTEINYAELYEGCSYVEHIDEFLENHGFIRVATTCPYHESWGDAFYVRKPVITMSTLGTNGRYGNQIFQYAFLKIYAKENNFKLETPAWVGQAIFGHDEPAISRKLPLLKENKDDKLLSKTGKAYKNTDFWGYFQYHTRHYRAHKDYFRSLFQPIPEIENKLQSIIRKRLFSRGKTIVGLHLRRGDYGYKHFFVAPTQWYTDWLKGFWGTLVDPVLFIASDEPEKVIRDFNDYHPVTTKDLGIEMAGADFYPDFYVLSHCDVVATSNSSFSFAACMLNERGKMFFRPHLPSEKLIPFDPWNSEVMFQDANVKESIRNGSSHRPPQACRQLAIMNNAV